MLSVNYYQQMCVSHALNGCHMHHMHMRCTVFEPYVFTCLDLISLQHIKTSDHSKSSMRSLCKSCVNRRTWFYQCFGCLLALQQWSAKQPDCVTSSNQHSRGLEKFAFLSSESVETHGIWCDLLKILCDPLEERKKISCTNSDRLNFKE